MAAALDRRRRRGVEPEGVGRAVCGPPGRPVRYSVSTVRERRRTTMTATITITTIAATTTATIVVVLLPPDAAVAAALGLRST